MYAAALELDDLTLKMTGSDATLNSFTSGATVKVRVTAANVYHVSRGHQAKVHPERFRGQPSAEVQIVVP